MCGVDFCSMRIDQDARDVDDGEMTDIDDETDLAESTAAEVNRPPVGEHDLSDAPDLSDFVDLVDRHSHGDATSAGDD